jgi:hypothetical protein
MNEKQIRIALKKEKTKKGIEKYMRIMGIFYDHEVNLATDRKKFQKTYNGFYRIRHPEKIFYEKYYLFMEKHKKDILSFPDTLDHLYKYGRLEASFASKLLHTINPELPIWDKYVLDYFKLKAPSRNMGEKERIKKANDVYEELKTKYKELQNKEEGKMMIEKFDGCYPEYKKDISPIKKIDFIIWQTRESVKSKKKTRG